MVVYSERPAPDGSWRRGFAFHTSPDLKSWRETSWLEGYFEAPDLFALPVDGDPNRVKWVLMSGPGYYAIGEFDGSKFMAETDRLPGPAGGRTRSGATGSDEPQRSVLQNLLPVTSVHAAQTVSNHPNGDRVQMAWGLVDTISAPFSQMMTFPTKLSLRTTSEGIRLCREPVDAIRSLRVHTNDFPAGPPASPSPLSGLQGDAWDIEATVRVGSINNELVFSIGGDDYVYQCAPQMLSGPTGAMPIPLSGGLLHLRILVDRTTVEVFGDRGQAYGLFLRSKPGGTASLDLRASHGLIEKMYVERLRVHALRSAWTG